VYFFCSPSAVRAFAAARAERPDCVAIGETTAAACREHGFEVRVATNPDLESMLRAAGLEIPTLETERPS
jgi:uroporphyrinogen-III synthase